MNFCGGRQRLAGRRCRSRPFAWKRAVNASVLPHLTVWISEAPLSKQPQRLNAPANCSEAVLWEVPCTVVDRTGQLQPLEETFTHWAPPPHPPPLKNKACRSVGVCLGILAVSVCCGRLLNDQWIILSIFSLPLQDCGSHSELLNCKCRKKKKKPTRTAPVTVRDVVCAWFTRVWLF